MKKHKQTRTIVKLKLNSYCIYIININLFILFNINIIIYKYL